MTNFVIVHIYRREFLKIFPRQQHEVFSLQIKFYFLDEEIVLRKNKSLILTACMRAQSLYGQVSAQIMDLFTAALHSCVLLWPQQSQFLAPEQLGAGSGLIGENYKWVSSRDWGSQLIDGSVMDTSSISAKASQSATPPFVSCLLKVISDGRKCVACIIFFTPLLIIDLLSCYKKLRFELFPISFDTFTCTKVRSF